MTIIQAVKRMGLDMYQVLVLDETGAREIAIAWSREKAEQIAGRYGK
jgi:hypothetical protein